MKNKLLKATTLFCIAAVVSGCNKEGAISSQDANVEPSRNPIEQLRTFRAQIADVKANPGAKSDETLSLADALWDVENTFNLTYTDAESYYSEMSEHEFTLYLPITTDQQVLVSDAVNLYSQAVVQAREAYANDMFEHKGFISLSIVGTEETRGQLRVTFSGKTGERTTHDPIVPHVEGPFGVDDDWMCAAPMGKCDDPDIPSGADEQFQEHLYDELIRPYTNASPGFRNIYIDRKRIVFDGTTYPGLYYNTNPNNLCIEHEYMNDHYSAERRVISQTIPDQYHLTNYSLISVNINGILLDNGAFTHFHEVEYGVRMEVCMDEFGAIEDLLAQ